MSQLNKHLFLFQIEHGADVNAADRGRGYTPLHGSAVGGSDEVARALVVKGAKLDAKGRGREGGFPIGLVVSVQLNPDKWVTLETDSTPCITNPNG